MDEEAFTPVKADVDVEEKHLSAEAMDEGSESELSPSPELSPSHEIKRKKLKVTNLSSSSKDSKTETTDSSAEDADVIQRQIIYTNNERQMSFWADEKDKNLSNDEPTNVNIVDNALKKVHLSLDTETEQDFLQAVSSSTVEEVSHDEEKESITESLSKGSSSIQASCFTPLSSPTSASSLEEDDDSSPSHSKFSWEKHGKGKHRQQHQPLSPFENSSEEEEFKKDQDEVMAHGHPVPLPNDVLGTEDQSEIPGRALNIQTSESKYYSCIESEPEPEYRVQRGRKPSPTVIPYTPSVTKSLKSVEESYEELFQKTKCIPGETPPDIEPLFGGMTIEDYLYESLVEESDIRLSDSEERTAHDDTSLESLQNLRSPGEVYKEMMQKKRELMMIEEEYNQSQTAMDISAEASVSEPPAVADDTCVITIPREETLFTEETDNLSSEICSEVPIKKKKRPAPPRPTDPPKRTEVTVIPCTPSTSICFVRPMIPQDPAFSKSLFPIPDLKITQCSSGEEEDDSFADDYVVAVSSDITPSDDSGTKEEPCTSPPFFETEINPLCVVCEIPQPKPIPIPISAPELTTTPSPVSPVSPPTSPSSPDSILVSNATYHFQTQKSLSSAIPHLAEPTLPVSFGLNSPSDISQQITTATSTVVLSREGSVSHSTLATIVTIPDVISDPTKFQATAAGDVRPSEFSSQAQVEIPSGPVVVQMPDLVSSPSQMPVETQAVIHTSVPSLTPLVVTAQPTALVKNTSVAISTPVSAHAVTTSVTLCPEPVIVQMPDLVSTTSPMVAQTSIPVSVQMTSSVGATAKVVHSFPVQQVFPTSPVVVAAQVQTPKSVSPALASTTVVKKKVPPPPPPRSTSVYSPEPNAELPLVKTAQDVNPSTTTTIATTITVSSQLMQSVIVDKQPRIEDAKPNNIVAPHIMTPTGKEHVVIVVPHEEKICILGQNHHDVDSTGSVATDSGLDISSAGSLLSPKLSAAQVESPSQTDAVDTVEIPVVDTPPPYLIRLPKSAVHPVSPGFSTGVTTSQGACSRPPPPIPPKPILIPAGLVFSHKPGESVKPPPFSTGYKAATLPRSKEPPNALSFSLTRPVESNLGTSSPKSPVSPRHSRSLQTYVVITLPSEPGSPTEVITVQAPTRRESISSTCVSGIQRTTIEQKPHAETFLAQAKMHRASIPLVRQLPTIPVPPTKAMDHATPSVGVDDQVKNERDSLSSWVHPSPSAAEVVGTRIQAQTVPIPIKKPNVLKEQSITYPLLPPKTISVAISIPPYTEDNIQPQTHKPGVGPQSLSSAFQHQVILTDAKSDPSQLFSLPQAPVQTELVQSQPLKQDVIAPLQSSHSVVKQNISTAFQSTVPPTQDIFQTQVLQKELMAFPYIPEESTKSLMLGNDQHIHIEEQPHEIKAVSSTMGHILPTDHCTVAELSLLSHTFQPLEETKSHVVNEAQQIAMQPEGPPVTYVPHAVILHSSVPQEVTALRHERETPTEVVTEMIYQSRTPVSPSMPVTVMTPKETIEEKKTVQTKMYYLEEDDIPTQVVISEASAATERQTMTMHQPVQKELVVHIPPLEENHTEECRVYVPCRRESITSVNQPQVISWECEKDQPLGIISTGTVNRRTSIPTSQDILGNISLAPVATTAVEQDSIKTQEMCRLENVVPNGSNIYSSISSLSKFHETQLTTSDVQSTRISVVHEGLPQDSTQSASITVQPDVAQISPLPKQNVKGMYPTDVIDLRTIRSGIKMTEKGMDLTQPDSHHHSFSSDFSGRPITAVQPEIVNLSSYPVASNILSVVTDNITIVTCTATIASYNRAAVEKPDKLQTEVKSLPVSLTTSKSFEPLAQIIYRPVNSPPVVSTVTTTVQDIPINLSFGTLVSPQLKQPSGSSVLFPEATGAMDLSIYKPTRTMIASFSTSPGVITTILEDDGTPVDLTAGRRTVCCDVIYKLPCTRRCSTQPQVITQPETHGHYPYNAEMYGTKDVKRLSESESFRNQEEGPLHDAKNNNNYLCDVHQTMDFNASSAGKYRI